VQALQALDDPSGGRADDDDDGTFADALREEDRAPYQRHPADLHQLLWTPEAARLAGGKHQALQ
jgi:hypothetical protein